jgi:hypothetical protein
MTLSPKQLFGMLAMLLAGAGGALLARDAGPQIFGVAIVGLIAIALSGTEGTPASLHKLVRLPASARTSPLRRRATRSNCTSC